MIVQVATMNVITAFAGYIFWTVLKRTSETMNADKQKAKEVRDKEMKKKEETRMLDIAVTTLFYQPTPKSSPQTSSSQRTLPTQPERWKTYIELRNNPTELECENAKDSKAKLDSAKAASELAVKLANIRSLDEAEAHNLWGIVHDNAKVARNAFIKADAAYTVAYTACKAFPV